MKYLGILFIFSLVSCGVGPEIKDRDINQGPKFNTTVCGKIDTPTPGGLSADKYYSVTNTSGTYYIQPQTTHVSNSLDNLTTYENICLYSMDDIKVASGGNIIYAEQIKIRLDGQDL